MMPVRICDPLFCARLVPLMSLVVSEPDRGWIGASDLRSIRLRKNKYQKRKGGSKATHQLAYVVHHLIHTNLRYRDDSLCSKCFVESSDGDMKLKAEVLLYRKTLL